MHRKEDECALFLGRKAWREKHNFKDLSIDGKIILKQNVTK
jgi:hypothetical protein